MWIERLDVLPEAVRDHCEEILCQCEDTDEHDEDRSEDIKYFETEALLDIMTRAEYNDVVISDHDWERVKLLGTI